MTAKDLNLRFVIEALPSLQDYLLSNELYWPLSGTLPRLTPGSLLLTLAFLSITEPVEAEKYHGQVDLVRSRWRTAWDKKISREFSNRMRLWSQYVSDQIKHPEQNMESFKVQVRGRVILQLLMDDFTDIALINELSNWDDLVKQKFIPGKFLWDSNFEILFPVEVYWFLYGSL